MILAFICLTKANYPYTTQKEKYLMDAHFRETVDIEKVTQVNLYISWKELEEENVNKIIDYAAEQPDAQSHITFLESYRNIILNHISTFRKAIETAKELSIEVNAYLNELDIKTSLRSNDMFKIGGTQFYTSYNRGTFSFITHIAYDHYSKMYIHAVFVYRYNGKGLIVEKKYIGFTDKKIEDVRKYPSYLLEEINKLDEGNCYEDVNAQYIKCRELLYDCLNVKERIELFEYKDPYFNLFWDEPIALLREMNLKRTNNVIKLQLKSRVADEVTENLISLIKTENELMINHRKYDKNNIFYGNQDFYEKRKKALTEKKNSLLNETGINQETLDKYMGYINLDIEYS